MTKVSPSMITALNTILIQTAMHPNADGFVHVREWFKDSWVNTGSTAGINAKTLTALETRGLIELKKEFHRRTGVFNPIANSWGYSTSSSNWYAKLTNIGTIIAKEFNNV